MVRRTIYRSTKHSILEWKVRPVYTLTLKDPYTCFHFDDLSWKGSLIEHDNRIAFFLELHNFHFFKKLKQHHYFFRLQTKISFE